MDEIWSSDGSFGVSDSEMSLRVFETSKYKAINKVREIIKRKQKYDFKITNKTLESNLKQIISKTDFLDARQYLEARVAADLKSLKQNKRLFQ